MPKTTAPLLSFDARGQIAKTQVYASWRGVPYARRYVIPNNPKTTKQMVVRNIFSMLNGAWLYAPAGIVNAWNASAVGKAFTGRNNFISKNQKALYDDPLPAMMDTFIFSPGVGGAPPPTDLVITPGSGQLSLAVSVPTPPTGWTLTASFAAAIPNQQADEPFGGVWASHQTASPGTPNVITGLQHGVEYIAGIFLIWQKPNGDTAYSISLADVATTT